MVCSSCGEDLRQGEKFCHECGTPVAAPIAPEEVPESAPQGVSLGRALKKAAKARVGTLSCGMQGHTWNGCTCTSCEAKRNKGHDYQRKPGICEQVCTICGKIEEKHDMQPVLGTCTQKCTACGVTIDNHSFQFVPGRCLKQCQTCGYMEKINCDYDNRHRCIRCGEKEKRSLIHLVPKDAKDLIGRAIDVVEKTIDKKS